MTLLVMGRPLDATAAQACGLVDAIVPPGDAEALKAAICGGCVMAASDGC